MAVCLREGRPVRDQQAILERPDGTRIPFAPYPTPLWDGEGKVVGAINMLVDITAHKSADERQKTLIAELNHRVKNSLATVQSLTRRTARHAKNVPEFAAALEARVIALARAHDLLSKRYWDGVNFGMLLHDIVAPFADVDERLVAAGDAVHLSPRAALSLTMALNELATNAAKYGALHGHHGTVDIRWKVHTTDARVFELDWVERGGPRVPEHPKRGFGSDLVTRCIERDLNGQCDLRFHTSGVHCRFVIPISELN
jgi:two-component sensor histidine kinase